MIKKFLCTVLILVLFLISFCITGCITRPSSVENQTSVLHRIPNVVIIGWDGVQRDHFWQCYNKQADCPDGLPNIKELRIFNITFTNPHDTATKLGWTQILSGYTADTMGIYSNLDYQPLPLGYSIFEKIENHFGNTTINSIFVSGKGDNVGATCPGEKGVEGLEEKGQPWCLTKESIDYFIEAEQNNLEIGTVGERALSLLYVHFKKNKDQTLLAFFHFAEPDHIGHMSGENSSKYSKMLIDNDVWLGKIIYKLKSEGIYKNTLIYVISDHGFDEDRSVHKNAPYTFLATNDPLIIRSGDGKDLAPTILQRYGVSTEQKGNIPAVQGHSLYYTSPLSCIPEGGAYLEYPDAPKCCASLTLISLDKYKGERCVPVTGGRGDDSGYCTKCGDNECILPENMCNCPEDCS